MPILGWSWTFAESIFLRRVWENDKKVLEHDIQQLLNGYPDNYIFNVCYFELNIFYFSFLSIVFNGL